MNHAISPARHVRGKFLTVLLLPVLLCTAIPMRAAELARPNIIVILADDMGYSDIGCFGSEIHTPNIDRLAAGGIRFTQFYNCARCNPTRAALLTGRYPHEAGMGFATDDLGSPAYMGHLRRDCVTLAEVLHAAGYTTLMAGKWHIGDDRPNWPIDRGFEHFFGLLGGAGSYWEVLPGHNFRMALDDHLWDPAPGSDYYLTDALTDHAISMIEGVATQQRPFFLYLAYTAPHYPLHARPEDIAKYRGHHLEGWDALRAQRYSRLVQSGLIDEQLELSPRDRIVPAWDSLSTDEKDAWDLRMAVYAAMIDRMDQGIGRVIEAVRKLGQSDNTLVLFLSDNGGCHIEPNPKTGGSDPNIPPGPKGGFWGYGPPWANASNTPFRKFKQYIHEGGISTPLICWWPDGIAKPGSINRQPGHVIDIMPTLLEVAHAGYPQQFAGHAVAPMSGLSFVPVFAGSERPEPPFFAWEHTGHRGLRQGRWKIVADRDGPWELYDMETDRTELHDRSTELPERLRDMIAIYDQWAADVGVVPWSEIVRRRREAK